MTTTFSSSLSPTFDPELGPEPTPRFPESDAVGIGTVRFTMPRTFVARFWLTCEWSTTERVRWLYTGGGTAGYPGNPIALFGETVSLDISSLLDGEGDPRSFSFLRTGDVAPYRIDPTATPVLSHGPDWTAGSVTFDHLRLDAEAWPPGPLPTPKELYERPLGGEPAAVDLAGSFEWSCGPMPDAVSTPGPSDAPQPSERPLLLPHATLTTTGGSSPGVRGCNYSWGTGGELSGAVDCGPSFQPLEDGEPIRARSADDLRFTLPSGYHFLAWSYEYADAATAALYRGAEPPGVIAVGHDASTTARSVIVAAPPIGEWVVRLTFDATNGNVIVGGMPSYFRLSVR